MKNANNLTNSANGNDNELVTAIKVSLEELNLNPAWAAKQIKCTGEYLRNVLNGAKGLTGKFKAKLLVLKEYLDGIRQLKQSLLLAA